jgi:hypothetical protein
MLRGAMMANNYLFDSIAMLMHDVCIVSSSSGVRQAPATFERTIPKEINSFLFSFSFAGWPYGPFS